MTYNKIKYVDFTLLVISGYLRLLISVFLLLAFITGLLHNIGTHVDPIKLIEVKYFVSFMLKKSSKGTRLKKTKYYLGLNLI